MNRSVDLQRESIARKKGLTSETSLELGHLRSLLMLLYIVTFAGNKKRSCCNGGSPSTTLAQHPHNVGESRFLFPGPIIKLVMVTFLCLFIN